MKLSIRQKLAFFVFGFIIQLTSCQNYLLKPNATPTVSNELQLANQVTTTPARYAAEDSSYLFSLSEGATSSLNPSPYFTNTPPNTPGTYLIFQEEYSRLIEYISTDGITKGNIFDLQKQNPPWSSAIILNNNPHNPILSFFSEKANNQIFAWITNLNGTIIKNWYGKIGINNNSNCTRLTISPDGRWLLKFCNSGIKQYVIQMEMESGTGESIPINSQCLNFSESHTEWSDNGEWVFINCAESQNIYCFFSTNVRNLICKDLGDDIYGISFSPDGSKLVIQEKKENGNSKPTDIHVRIEDRNCLLQQTSCNNITKYDLPFYQPILDMGYINDFQWDSSGQKLYWLVAPITGQDSGAIGLDPSSCGVIDIQKDTNVVLWQWLPRNTRLISITPDDQQLLFSDNDGLFITSWADKTHHRIVNPADKFGTFIFYGWLVIRQ
jgi:hypothetical protein